MPDEGHRDRAEHHEADQALVDRPLAQVHGRPNGRITTAATRSLEIAADGVTPNSRISIGVISAPPPAPVKPTRNPMMAAPRTMYGSTCMTAAGASYMVPHVMDVVCQ